MMDYAYDFSIVPGPDPAVLVRANAKGILGYSFGARQSNEYLTRIRATGMKVVWIWERNTDSIFYADGVAECKAHEASAKPGELTYVACDTNDGGVAGRDLTPFLRDWQATTREAVFGLYGSSGAIRQGMNFGGKLQRFWGVVNWINGGKGDNHPDNIRYWTDVGAHLIQLIGSDIPDTDQNLILKDDWADISGSASTTPLGTKETDFMILSSNESPPTFHLATSEGVAKTDQGTAYAMVVSGVPWIKDLPPLGILGIAINIAQAKKGGEKILSKLPA
jgi:hypothetical protein